MPLPTDGPQGSAAAARACVAHLTSVHHPFDTRIFHRECRALAAAGYDVTLIAPHEGDERRDGISVRAVPRPRSRPARVTATTCALWRLARAQRAALYHFHDPELIGLGLLLKLTGSRVIYDVHEDVPRAIREKHYLRGPLRSILAIGAGMAEALAGRFLDGIVAATPRIARRFPPHKTTMVRNFPALDEFQANALPYGERPAHVAYVGGISVIRGAREMVEAIGYLSDGLAATLVMVGDFVPATLRAELATRPGWKRVQALGRGDRRQVAAVLGRARVGLVTLHPTDPYLSSYPVKMFEYMAAGIPVVASDFPEWRPFIADTGAGLLVDPLNTGAIAEAVSWLLTHPSEAAAMGKAGRAAVESKYHWSGEAKRLRALYAALIPGGSR